MSEAVTSGKKLRVGVLMGGSSSERPVSLATGKMILALLDPDRYEAFALDTPDLFAVANDESRRPDVVFIALHGKGGEDGTVQGVLEFLGIPYTGSGVLASALAMDKSLTKRLFQSAGIPVIEGLQVARNAVPNETELREQVAAAFPYPVFVKPNAEGSTFGCTLVATPEELAPAVAAALTFDDTAIIERYVRGMEITVGVLDDTSVPGGLLALPVIEIVPKNAIYDYESKYSDGGSEHIIPARLSPELTAQAQDIARRCHTLLGCRAMSRTDMIVEGEQIYVLETNTIPGMTPTSLLPDAARVAGIPFPALLDRIITTRI